MTAACRSLATATAVLLTAAACLLAARYAPTAAIKLAPTAAATTRIVLSASGSAPVTTSSFTASSDVALVFAFDCHGRSDDTIRITDSNGMDVATSTQPYGGGSVPIAAGQHQLTVTSRCQWNIAVTE